MSFDRRGLTSEKNLLKYDWPWFSITYFALHKISSRHYVAVLPVRLKEKEEVDTFATGQQRRRRCIKSTSPWWHGGPLNRAPKQATHRPGGTKVAPLLTFRKMCQNSEQTEEKKRRKIYFYFPTCPAAKVKDMWATHRPGAMQISQPKPPTVDGRCE